MRGFVVLGAVLGLAMAAVPASASGTRGGGGSFGGTFESGSGTRSATSEADRMADRGRSQVRRRITCESCEYHDRLNAETAREVIRAVQADEFDLNARNKEAVLFYLRRRYNV